MIMKASVVADSLFIYMVIHKFSNTQCFFLSVVTMQHK